MKCGFRRGGGGRALAVWFVTALLACGASATVIVKKTFTQLCASADIVLCGTVTQVEGRRDPGSGVIHTYYTIDDVEWIAGGPQGQAAATRYVLRALGGRVDGETMTVHGMPRLALGTRYVLFVGGNEQRACPIVGWQQGCFHVAADDDGTSRVLGYRGGPAAGDEGGSILRDAQARRIVGGVEGADEEGAHEPAAAMTLDRFVERIRAARERAGESRGRRDDAGADE